MLFFSSQNRLADAAHRAGGSCSPRRVLAGFAFLVSALSLPALGQVVYPSAPIKMVVAFPPGGVTDLVARMIGPGLAQRLGQPVVVENRPGAGGSIGTAAVARAPADGYTLLFTNDVLGKNQHVYKDPGFDAVKDFAPVAFVGSSPFIFVAYPGVAANDMPSLVKALKNNPGSMTYASVGTGSNTHLAAKLLEAVAGVQMVHVPYKGGGPAINDLIGGHVQTMFQTITTAMPLLQTKRQKALAVASGKRVPKLPNVPTMAEQGYPGVEMDSWLGVIAPAGTPAPVIAKLRDAIKEIVVGPDFVKRLEEQGFEVNFMGPAEFGTYIRTELTRWGDLIRKENITAQ